MPPVRPIVVVVIAAAVTTAALILSHASAADPQPAPRDGQASSLEAEVRRRAADIEAKVIEWRRQIHQHPELGDQEKRTSKLVADHLHQLGLEVRTGIARTGVVGVLRGAKPGRTV